jgi:hypothetical protein
MSDQEDPMRTTVKPVYQWTTPDSENPRRRKIEKWLFGAMFLWPVVLMVSVDITYATHGEFANYLTYTGSTIFTTILAVIALCNYPASRRFLKWLAAIILLTTLYLGVMAYGDSLQHGFWWVESVTGKPVFWLYLVLVVLSAIYLIVPQRAWGWVKTRAKLLWKRIGHGRSI